MGFIRFITVLRSMRFGDAWGIWVSDFRDAV